MEKYRYCYIDEGKIRFKVREVILKNVERKKQEDINRKNKLDVIAEKILAVDIYNERNKMVRDIEKQAIDMGERGHVDPFIFKVSNLRIIDFEREGEYYSLLEKKADDEMFKSRFLITKIIQLVRDYFFEYEYLNRVEIIEKEDGTYLSIRFQEDRDVPDLTTYD